MKENMTRPYLLAKKLSHLLDLESKIEAVLSVSMYYLNQYMDAERSSIFLIHNCGQELTVFSSLDLKRHEIRIPRSRGIAGWVFANRKPALVNNAYEDNRFYKAVDEMTGFHTRNLICTPLLDFQDHCLGTLQSLNRKRGHFTTDDLELLKLAARIMAVAINNSRRFNEVSATNDARRRFIAQIVGNIGNPSFPTNFSSSITTSLTPVSAKPSDRRMGACGFR